MKRKVTYQIDAQLVASVRDAVENGAANSMSEFVQDALAQRLAEIRRQEIRSRIAQAGNDPLFVQDVRETTAAFDATLDDGLMEPAPQG